MAEPYADYQFRFEVHSPVAGDSPFDSDTLWGRVLSVLFEGPKAEAAIANRWLDELKNPVDGSNPSWNPPLLISEGFQCDAEHRPWLPIPLATKLELEQSAKSQRDLNRKSIKKINYLPLPIFSDVSRGAIPSAEELLELHEPSSKPVLQPHLAMNRASNMGIDGQFYSLACKIYSPPEITFFIRLRHGEDPELIQSALQRVCREGWGKAKSRGLGRICFKRFEAWQLPDSPGQANAFVSLSHFCPAVDDPTEGFWKLQTKDPVPPQFVNGQRVALGEKQQWRVKSFLRLQAGSCFRLADQQPLRAFYGRVLKDLLDPGEDGAGQPLPALFHYAFAFPLPMKWPEEGAKE